MSDVENSEECGKCDRTVFTLQYIIIDPTLRIELMRKLINLCALSGCQSIEVELVTNTDDINKTKQLRSLQDRKTWMTNGNWQWRLAIRWKSMYKILRWLICHMSAKSIRDADNSRDRWNQPPGHSYLCTREWLTSAFRDQIRYPAHQVQIAPKRPADPWCDRANFANLHEIPLIIIIILSHDRWTNDTLKNAQFFTVKLFFYLSAFLIL